MNYLLSIKNQHKCAPSRKPSLRKVNPTKSVAPKATVCIVNGKEKMRNFLYRIANTTSWDIRLYSSAEVFLESMDSVRPNCLLLDIDAPRMGGFTLQAQLQEQRNFLPIIFVSAHGTVTEAVQALQAGAADFIVKPFRQSLLLKRIRECVEKNRKAEEAQRQREEVAARISKLTPREREVMELVVKGKLNKVIASELNISIKTVEIHRAHVMKKLHVDSQAELIQLALRG
jgi:RNA polymerase sigma factor (sigma-70 family)